MNPLPLLAWAADIKEPILFKSFWNLLAAGDEAFPEPFPYRWTKEHATRVSQQDEKSQARFLSKTVDEFDAQFFGVYRGWQ